MRRYVLSILALCCAFALVATAAPIDGKWVATMKMPAPKKQGRGPTEAQITFDLKSDGDKLTGTVSGGPGRRAPTMTIENGKISGGKFSFTTVQKTRQGQERRFSWEGTVQGDELTGTRSPERGRRGAQFTAKRQS